MQLETAVGEISLAEENLRTSLAACAGCQSLLNVGSVAAALERIFPCGLPLPPLNDDGTQPDSFTPDQEAALRPYVVVYADENGGTRFARTASPDTVDAAGILKAEFYVSVPEELANNLAAIHRHFNNLFGVIAKELLSFSQGPYLIADKITVGGPWRVHPDDAEIVGDHISAMFTILYGTGRVA